MNNTENLHEAEAIGFLRLGPELVRKIKEKEEGMDEMIPFAENAGKQAVEKLPSIVPNIRLHPGTLIRVNAWVYPNGVEVRSQVSCTCVASLESEALMAVITALITLFEKYRDADPSAAIADLRLVKPAR
jgi:cyclic pyranopterin phosphate synthase